MKNFQLPNTLSNLYLIVLLVTLVLPILFYCIIGSYARYAADDYQFSADVRDLGFVTAQVQIYQNWTGRFAYILTNSLIYQIGRWIVPYLPISALVLLSFGWYRVFRIYGLLFLGDKVSCIALLFSFTIILSTFAPLEKIRQVLYWPAGMLNYVSPMILLPYILGSILHFIKYKLAGQKPPKYLYFLIPILAFLAGAYTEAFSALQMLLYIGLIFICWVLVDQPYNRELLRIFSLALFTAFISTLIVVAAPGNAIRQAYFPPPPSLPELLRMTSTFTYAFLKQQISRNLTFLVLALFFPWLASITSDDINISTKPLVIPKFRLFICLIAIPLLGFLLIATAFAVSAWGTSTYPEPRTVSISQYILSITIVIWGILVGVGMRLELKSKEISTFVFFLLCVVISIAGPIKLMNNQYNTELPAAQKFAYQWERRDSILRLAAQQNVQEIGVPKTIDYYDLAELQPYSSRDNWINVAMSRYYKIKTIYLDDSKR